MKKRSKNTENPQEKVVQLDEVQRRKKRRRIRYKDDLSLSPGERVRRRYQFLRHDHSDWMPGSTAREKLPDRAADIYEYARYSEHTVSAEDANAFVDIAKHL